MYATPTWFKLTVLLFKRCYSMQFAKEIISEVLQTITKLSPWYSGLSGFILSQTNHHPHINTSAGKIGNIGKGNQVSLRKIRGNHKNK